MFERAAHPTQSARPAAAPGGAPGYAVGQDAPRSEIAGAPHSFGKITTQAVLPSVMQAVRDGRAPLQPPPESATEGSGLRLPQLLRGKMEAALGQSFGDVRVHLSKRPAALGLKAYTRGAQLHFAPGAYEPRTHAGQELIGRQLSQLTRQRQARGGVFSGDSELERMGYTNTSLNDEADRAAERAVWGLPARLRRAAPLYVR